MPVRKKHQKTLLQKALALEVIDRLKKNTQMPAVHWIMTTPGSFWSACVWRPSAPMPA